MATNHSNNRDTEAEGVKLLGLLRREYEADTRLYRGFDDVPDFGTWLLSCVNKRSEISYYPAPWLLDEHKTELARSRSFVKVWRLAAYAGWGLLVLVALKGCFQ